VGTLLDKPCVTAQARQKNFTNLGGAGGKVCFLKNVNGMWLLRQCLDHWEALGYSWTIDALLRVCAELPAPDFLLDVDDPDLLLPGNMPGKINAQRARAGKGPLPDGSEGAPALANTIFHSLAARYAEVFRDISEITGKTFNRLYVVGGGSRNVLLNRLTAGRSGLELRTGAPESATIGNFAVQMAALDGDCDPCIGVSHAAVAKWAGVLSTPTRQNRACWGPRAGS
jgi:rhamnulokinase